MAHLTLAGLSGDKTRLLLVDDAGNEHTLDIDGPLRAALRGDPARIGQLEIQMESALRPRDIQARIRSGETADAVAQAAQTTVDKIMGFAAPVLAERAHMADRAQRASVRRKSGDAGARTLGESVGEQLRTANVPAEALSWDAWRREDGRWTLTADYTSSARTGGARFSFDPPGNYVVAENDDARWLVGELPPAEAPVASRRRLSSVAADELPLGEELGDDALEMVADTADLSETVGEVRQLHPSEEDLERTLGAEAPADAFLDRVLAEQNPEGADAFADLDAPVDGAAPVDEPVADSEPADHDEDPHRRRVKKTRGRASVPSWDEIMFGGGKND